jgi:hypothetical protein
MSKRTEARLRTIHAELVTEAASYRMPAGFIPAPIPGEAPADLWAALVALVEACGYDVVVGVVCNAYGDEDPWTWGRADAEALSDESDYSSPRVKRVSVASHLSHVQRCITLAHELAHLLMHPPGGPYLRRRVASEVEAESVAYLVARLVGIDNAASTTQPFITEWANGRRKQLLNQTADRAISVASVILDALSTGTTGGVVAFASDSGTLVSEAA